MESPDWVLWSDEELLERRISKLGLRLETTPLEPLIQQLYAELSATGLAFHPPTHVGDEFRRFSFRFSLCTIVCARWSGR